MWQGLANCYMKLSRYSDAIKAYKRAVLGGSTDITILSTLAALLEQQGDMKSAASFQYQIIAETTMPGTEELTPMGAKAHLWLARMEIVKQDYEAAEGHINQVLKGHYVFSLEIRLIIGTRRGKSTSK
jgi:tetratricopeptide (TPR) repeat protein